MEVDNAEIGRSPVSLRAGGEVMNRESPHENMAAVDLATGIGALDAAAASRIQHLGLRFKRMLWKPRAG